jgi:hypothetical protein
MRNKTKKQKSKRGELTTQQIIMLIIVITSFVVILFLLFRLNLGETSNKEICHNSVVLKSTGKGLAGQLDCTTNYLCISGGGECEDINPTITIKVDPNNKEEIMKVIADEMADCWWMFGEGKLDYADFEALKAQTVCAICSIVKFDEKIQEVQGEGITYEEFINNLNILKDDSESYLHYFYGVYTVEDLLNKFEVIKEDYETRTISLRDRYMIRTGETKASVAGQILRLGTGKISYILPYFFETDRDVDPECDEFVTKA